jgi:hypothetical protein
MSAATETTTIATIATGTTTARELSFDMITDGTADGIATATAK